MADARRLRVERLGRRGEGVAQHDGAPVYIPYGLPGETVLAEVSGERGHLLDIVEPRPDRIAPICPYYGRCGGCAVQTLPAAPYGAWKRGLVSIALERAGVAVAVGPLIDAHGEGRRRATFHARFDDSGAPPRVGFMEARAHALVDIELCQILAPAMGDALPAARHLAGLLAGRGKPLDILVTATDGGLDVDLRGLGPADPGLTRRLVAAADDRDLARLSNHGTIVVERRRPSLRMGEARVVPPPGAFLQATRLGETVLAELVTRAVARARSVADLFCGIGTFALRLAREASVTAWDSEPGAIAALAAARSAPGLRPIEAKARDLVRRPLLASEFSGCDAVVFDPPRAGAAAQAAEIARSGVRTVVAVSCDPGSFARDAATLVGGGYALESVTPVDQFRYSPHVEIVAVFRRAKAERPRRLLS